MRKVSVLKKTRRAFLRVGFVVVFTFAVCKAQAAELASTTYVQGAVASIISALENYIPITQRGAAGGVATLDSDGLVPLSQLPELQQNVPNATTDTTGIVRLGAERIPGLTTTPSASSTAGRYYPVQTDNNDRLVVNVPWLELVDAVLLTGDQTVQGVKNFTISPLVPTPPLPSR